MVALVSFPRVPSFKLELWANQPPRRKQGS